MSAIGVETPSSAAARTQPDSSRTSGAEPARRRLSGRGHRRRGVLLRLVPCREREHGDWLLFAVLTACAAPSSCCSVESPAHQCVLDDARLLRRRRPPAPAAAGRTDDRPRPRPGVGRGRVRLVRPDLQHRQLGLRRADRVYFVCGAVRRRAATPSRHLTRLALAARSPPQPACSSTTCCSPRCSGSPAARPTARAASSRFGNLSTELVPRRARGRPRSGLGARAGARAVRPRAAGGRLPLAEAAELELAARLDPKTDLFNARYFTRPSRPSSNVRGASSGRCRSCSPTSTCCATVNNTYGHLAGDAVLRGVARRAPIAAPPLRHPLPVRRRGVRGRAARGRARGGAGDRRADPPGSRSDARSGTRAATARSGRRSRSGLRPIRSSRRRTTSSTRPISALLPPRRSGGTASRAGRARGVGARHARAGCDRGREAGRRTQLAALGRRGRLRRAGRRTRGQYRCRARTGHARACRRVRRRQLVASCPRVRRARAAGRYLDRAGRSPAPGRRRK